MPTLAQAIGRVADEETADASTITQVYYNIGEKEFDSFSQYLYSKGCILIDYTNYGKVSYLLPAFETIDAGSDFGEKVSLLFDIKTALYPALEAKLTEAFNGKPELEIRETHFVPFPEP